MKALAREVTVGRAPKDFVELLKPSLTDGED